MGVYYLCLLVHYQGDDPVPMSHRIVVLIMLISIVLIAPSTTDGPQPSNPRFIIASWDYPDDYGQGIVAIRAYQNISGSWVSLTPFDLTSGESTALEINYTATGVKILVKCWLNNTVVEAVDFEDGKNYIRHNVTLTLSGETIFSLQNFTYTAGTDSQDPMFYYQYEGIIPFSPVEGAIYTAVVDCEIYFEGLEYGGPYLHNCSDTHDITYDSDAGLDPSDYGIGSNGSVIEIWIVPDSVADEKVIYKLEFTNIDDTDGDVNLTTRYRVEDGFTGFRLDLYYTDTTWDSTGLQTSQTWANLTIDADSGKTLDYALLYCDDSPNTVTSGNRSVYVDFVEITNEAGSLAYLVDQWNEVSEIRFLFSVPFNMWSYNTSLIILGLVMIPVSTIYLAYGAKHDRSSNRLFYGLILLFLGCGLFIGGILP